MGKKTKPTNAEQHLVERLSQHPKLKERMLAILDLAERESGTADELEALLVEEVRRLGAETMGEWARGMHTRVVAEVAAEHPASYRSKKKR